MNKAQFINTLKQGLKKHNINDVDDIIYDYENYFEEQALIGKTEVEISNKLGNLDSIISDYAKSTTKTKTKWFDLVTVGFVAVPLLIILYGVILMFIGGAIASWAIAIYYLFRLDSLAFMPPIPVWFHLIYVLLMLIWALFFFSLSIRLTATIKSMTTQFVVQQKIRIGNYNIKNIYTKLFNYSLILGIGLLVVVYLISSLAAKSFEFWHVWHWFS